MNDRALTKMDWLVFLILFNATIWLACDIAGTTVSLFKLMTIFVGGFGSGAFIFHKLHSRNTKILLTVLAASHAHVDYLAGCLEREGKKLREKEQNNARH